MIYKLPKEKRDLSKELIEKINNLKPDNKEWYKKFDDCKPDKDLYENLMKDIQKGNIQSNTIQDQKYLEEKITRKENELLQLLNHPIDKTPFEAGIAKTQLLSGQGVVNIRPPKGKYEPLRIRHQSWLDN